MAHWNKIYLRRGVTVSVLAVQTAGGDGEVDLTVTTIERADEKSLVQIVDELDRTIERARRRRGRAVEETNRATRHIPFLFMNAFLRLLFHASVLARTVREMLEDPFRCLDRMDADVPTPG